MNLKKVKSQDINAFLKETAGLERDYISELIKSRRLAWRVAGASGLVAAIAVGAVAALVPMKTTETVVLRVSDTTGTVDVIPTVKEKEVELSELQHKQLIKQYVEMRHSYDWGTLQANYDRLGLMSFGSAWDVYAAQFEGDSPLQDRLRDKFMVDARTISINLLPKTGNAYNAIVQFSTQKKDDEGKILEPPQYHTATISYEINPALLAGQKEDIRMQNLLGFAVYGYNAVTQYEDKNVARTAQ